MESLKGCKGPITLLTVLLAVSTVAAIRVGAHFFPGHMTAIVGWCVGMAIVILAVAILWMMAPAKYSLANLFRI